MKKFLLFLLLSAPVWLLAQNFKLSGTIADDAGLPLPGAVVVLQYPWGEVVKNSATDAQGQFQFNSVGKGGYKLQASFLGFDALTKEVTIKDKDIALGLLKLTANATLLKEAEIKDKLTMAVQKADTTEFNAGAFKVMKDATTEDLLQKIPSVTVENGQLKAQGETVQQVLVDGKPFFGNDPSAAIKNLPAEVIEKVQLFDAQSEQSQFTRFNDGNTVKTINIVTKNGLKTSQFGKVYAGYGHKEKYQAGGNINFFDGNRRISILGMSNNINIQNFSTDDILGAMGGGNSGRGGGGGRGGMGGGGGRGGGGRGYGDPTSEFLVQPTGGIAKTNATGLNFTDKWGTKTEFSGSYFFNNSITNATTVTARQYFTSDGEANELYDENNTAYSNNTNHRVNIRLEYKPDSMNTWTLRPRLTLQKNHGNSAIFGETNRAGVVQNNADNRYGSDLTGANFTNNLIWRHRFQKQGRTVSIDFSQGYAPKKGNSELLAVNQYFLTTQTRIDSLDQQSALDINSWNAAANVEYTEPLGKKGQVNLSYRTSIQQEDSDKKTYDYSPASESYNALNSPLSNVFSNDYRTQQAGLGYQHNVSKDISFSGTVRGQWATFVNDQTFPKTANFDHQFFNILPSGSIRYTFDKNRNFRLFYRASTQLPTVTQLQNVVDNSNPLQLSTGNPDLVQSEQHNVFMRYQGSNPTKSTTLFAMLSGSLTKDYIGNSTFFANKDNPIFTNLDILPGAQLTQPVNLSGQYSARSFLSYGMPLKGLKTNLNFDAGWNYSRSPGLINEVKNITNSHTFSAGLTFASNISENLDFTLSLRPALTRTTNNLQTDFNSQNLSQNSRFKFSWLFYKGMIIRSDITHQLNSGLSDGFNQNYWLWNIAFGKKVFKNQRGELALSINDVLNQNRDIRRTVTEVYVEDVRTNALTQFVMLSFTYNLRNINTGKKATESPRQEDRHRF